MLVYELQPLLPQLPRDWRKSAYELAILWALLDAILQRCCCAEALRSRGVNVVRASGGGSCRGGATERSAPELLGVLQQP